MNHSLIKANRETHVRIVALALVAGILVVVGALNLRHEPHGTATAAAAAPAVVKATRQGSYAHHGLVAVR